MLLERVSKGRVAARLVRRVERREWEPLAADEDRDGASVFSEALYASILQMSTFLNDVNRPYKGLARYGEGSLYDPKQIVE